MAIQIQDIIVVHCAPPPRDYIIMAKLIEDEGAHLKIIGDVSVYDDLYFNW